MDTRTVVHLRMQTEGQRWKIQVQEVNLLPSILFNHLNLLIRTILQPGVDLVSEIKQLAEFMGG
uniref:Uncharacterized protein n=1 Tax=Anguilla anguilla TaxID=7936 RepID=A0A0E9V3P5_ANGAN